MGWFDSQIRERISNNKQQLQKAYWNLASVVMKETNETFADTRSTGNQNALTQICRYFHLEVNTVPDNIVDLEEQMEYLFRPSGIMRRRIKLAGEWWKDCYGPILAERKDGQMIALLQGKGDHYYYQDIKGKSKNRVDSQTAKELCEEAVCFYRPLPQRELTQKDLFKFILKSFTSLYDSYGISNYAVRSDRSNGDYFSAGEYTAIRSGDYGWFYCRPFSGNCCFKISFFCCKRDDEGTCRAENES